MRASCLGIVGATCTGKSALAVALAQKLGGEIINADALQIYRGLDIGTAKPDDELRRAVPHHLIDIRSPQERFSAGEFARLARAAVADIRGRGHLPIVVGGSGLYLRALFEGLAEIPAITAVVRDRVRVRLREEGPEALWEHLRAVDPASATRLERADGQRIARAVEVLEETGRPLSSWLGREGPREGLEGPRIGLTLPRGLLYDRIASRVHQMVRDGWLEEVRQLLDSGVSPLAPAFQAIGYRQLVGHLEGRADLDDTIGEIVRETRRYAKRQETWFKKENIARWFRSSPEPDLIDDVLTFLRAEGLET